MSSYLFYLFFGHDFKVTRTFAKYAFSYNGFFVYDSLLTDLIMVSFYLFLSILQSLCTITENTHTKLSMFLYYNLYPLDNILQFSNKHFAN